MMRRILLLALGLAVALPLGAARAADHIRVGIVRSLGPAPSATWDAAVTDAAGQRADQAPAPEIRAIAAKYIGQPESLIKFGINYFDPQSRIRMADIQQRSTGSRARA